MTIKKEAYHYRLRFRHAFHIAHGQRTHTDTILVIISDGQYEGFGEAALPPYLGYSPAAVINEINHHPLAHAAIPEMLQQVHQSELSSPAKAALDIALYDLWSKQEQKPLHVLLQLPLPEKQICFYTLGISNLEELEEKLETSKGTQVYKIKLGGKEDLAFLRAFRQRSDVAFCADANQAWKSEEEAYAMMVALADLGCIFIEQPLPVNHEASALLAKRSPIPVYMDESVQCAADIYKNAGNCHGINIKLVKTGGIQPALECIRVAKELDLKILSGCMSESSCGAAAALQISGYSEYTDLDGPLLITNDPFKGLLYEEGCLLRPGGNGTGITKNLNQNG